MYNKKETDISYDYLKIIISKLKDPIIIIGGWATYLTVNSKFKSEFGIDYIGSRDVDLGFNTLKSFKDTSNILEENGFKLISYRYLKEINYETGKELTKEESMTTPIYNIFPMYIDLLIAKTNKKIIAQLGFAPADEPLVKLVFKNKKYRTELVEFNKKLWLPSPSLLLATKINSVVNREKTHKKIKDYCDIVALCLYSGENIDTLITFIKKYTIKERLLKFKTNITKEELEKISNILRINKDIIERVILKIIE
jgi:hypothetical protein